jgi:hypothetical protein
MMPMSAVYGNSASTAACPPRERDDHPCRVGGAHLTVNGPQPRVSAVLLPADAQFNRLPAVQRIIIG